jgi:hypothetical protein
MRVLLIPAYAFSIYVSFSIIAANRVSGKNTYLYRPLILHDIVRREAFNRIDFVFDVERRAAAPQQSALDGPSAVQGAPTSPPRSTQDSGELFSEQSFNTSTNNACADALRLLNSVANPTGLAACYNIPFLDETTNEFEADVRLYQVTEPTGDFSGTVWTDFMLGVMIPNAIISSPQRMPVASPDATGDMLMLQDFRHMGKINSVLQLAKLSP